jgi:hypothetical protein
MKHIDEILTLKCLAFKHQNANSSDQIFDNLDLNLPENSEIKLKNVCAKLSESLVSRLDEACVILDLSKRRFIELAIIEALDNYESLASQYDIFEPHTVVDPSGKTPS